MFNVHSAGYELKLKFYTCQKKVITGLNYLTTKKNPMKQVHKHRVFDSWESTVILMYVDDMYCFLFIHYDINQQTMQILPNSV